MGKVSICEIGNNNVICVWLYGMVGGRINELRECPRFDSFSICGLLS